MRLCTRLNIDKATIATLESLFPEVVTPIENFNEYKAY